MVFRVLCILAATVALEGFAPANAALDFTAERLNAASSFLVVSGEFEDSDDLSRFSEMLRQSDIRVVTFDSGGGNVLKAIELGRLIRQYKLDTVQLRKFECASACALAFFGGQSRFAEPGSIGVHQASFADSSVGDVGAAVSTVQQLTAVEIAYINEMGVDARVLQVALQYGPDDIRYLSSSEMKTYRVVTAGGSDIVADATTTPPEPSQSPSSSRESATDWTRYGEWIQIFSAQVLTNAVSRAAEYRRSIPNTHLFQYDNGWFAAVVGPFGQGRGDVERDAMVADGVIPPDSFVVRGDRFVSLVGPDSDLPTEAKHVPADLVARASDLAMTFQRSWSLPNQAALDYLDTLYAPTVTYYGQPTSKQDVLGEKATFATRWPTREYVVRPGTIHASCGADSKCIVSGVVDWYTASTLRKKSSSGSASFVLTFAMYPSPTLISETSSVLDRHIADLPAGTSLFPRK